MFRRIAARKVFCLALFCSFLGHLCLHVACIPSHSVESGGCAKREAPARMVAIGDIHGDAGKLRAALRLAGVLHDTADEWVGNNTVVVQVGDQVDRGDDEIEVLALLRRVRNQAQAAGGDVHVLVGNHELMAAMADFRYATPGAIEAFDKWNRICSQKENLPSSEADANWCELWTEPLVCAAHDTVCNYLLPRLPAAYRSRFLALRPAGPIASNVWGAENHAVLLVGNTLFVHGGFHVNEETACQDIEHANHATAAWMQGFDATGSPTPGPDGASDEQLETTLQGPGEKRMRNPPNVVADPEGPFWTRIFSNPTYSAEEEAARCLKLQRVLEAVGAERMVVGHTPQLEGIAEGCGGRVWRVDVAMSSGMGGQPAQVLEILDNGPVTILK